MKIKVLFTGGTIGSQFMGSVLNVTERAVPLLFSSYKNIRPSCDIEFSSETVFSVLSENMTLSNWKLLYDRIIELKTSDIDGIIITHGTDTLAYTASFFSFMIGSTNFPILLVSSDYPLDDPRSNGISNFIAAVDFISQEKTKGVFVPFCKNSENAIVHLGARMQQAQHFVHCFSSLGNVVYGYMSQKSFVRNLHENNPTPTMIEKEPLILIPCFPKEKRILYLKAYPGMDYSMLDFREKPDAIIHGLFHSGTACATPENEHNSIIVFAKRCIAQGIDFYAAPFDGENTLYDTTKIMIESGIRLISNVSSVAAYTKLVIAYGSFKHDEERLSFINSDIACEHFR
jgi:L-asparaginase